MTDAFWNPSDQFLVWAANVFLQVGLLTALAMLIALPLRYSSAARYWLLCSALFVVVACPLLTALAQSSGLSLISVEMIAATPEKGDVLPEEVATVPQRVEAWQQKTLDETVAPPLVSPEVDVVAFERQGHHASETVHDVVSPAPDVAISSSDSMPALPPSPTMLGRILRFVGPPMILIWAIVAAGLLGRLLIRWHRLSTLLGSAEPNTEDAFATTLQAACVELGIDSARVPALVFSSDVSGPIAAGIRSPKVVLPAALVRQMNSEQLRNVLIHELAHIARRDQIIVLLQNFVSAVFWIHPLVRLLNRQLAKAREEVCDNYVLAHTKESSYCRTLLTLGQLLSSPRQTAGAVGLFNSHWKLEHRIAGLLDQQRNRAVQTTLAGKLLVTVIAAILMLLTAASTMSLAEGPVISQADDQTAKSAPNGQQDSSIVESESPSDPTKATRTQAESSDRVTSDEPGKARDSRTEWARGKVLEVKQFGDRYDVRISVGEDAGIAVGLRTNAYIGPELAMPKLGKFPVNYVATGQIVDVGADGSTCNIGPTLFDKTNGVPKPGDDVLVRIKAKQANFIVAKHVVIHEGRTIPWDEVRDRLAELNEEGLIDPNLIFTKSMRDERDRRIAEFEKWCEETAVRAHSFRTLHEQESSYYDSITSEDDLKPTAARKVGTVVMNGVPIGDAQIILYTLDEGLVHEVYLEHGELRDPEPGLLRSRSTPNGRFAIYPKGERFQLLILHKKGMALVNSDQWKNQTDIELQPWATISGKFDGPIEFNEIPQFETTFEMPGWASIYLYVWDTPLFADRRFQNHQIPPGKVRIKRQVFSPRGGGYGIWHGSLNLAPGEKQVITIGAHTDAGRKRAEEYLEREKR